MFHQITPDSEQKLAARAALSALQVLHSLAIKHGDISESNVILQRTDDGYSAVWVDLSSSIVYASYAILSREWQKAIEYFSQLVGSILGVF
jgi:RIO-like serine/threonine protein kinase